MPIPLGRELHWLIRQARPVLRLQIAGVLCIIGSSWLYLVDPLVMKWLLDSVLPRRSLTGLFVGLLLILACSVGHLLLSASGTLLTVEASQKMVLDLRRRLLRHLDKLSRN
jgi:ABC-type bacteriocin/lantibiotic exporter with double-glycine peptidase domain